jgi:hypothetical protein
MKANNVILQKDFEVFLFFVQIFRMKEILNEMMCNLLLKIHIVGPKNQMFLY